MCSVIDLALFISFNSYHAIGIGTAGRAEPVLLCR